MAIEESRDGTRFVLEGEPVEPASHPDLVALLRVGVLCNTSALPSRGREERGRPPGDPMETALLEVGAAAGLDRAEVLGEAPEVGREAFDPETRTMATLHEAEGGFLVALKGAPEALVEAAGSVRRGGEEHPLSAEDREAWRRGIEAMAEEGLRVLALARRRTDDPSDTGAEGATLLGLVGFLDPPREDVRASIDACREAGVRVVMVTGDHPATARNVAGAVGIGDGEERVVLGTEIGEEGEPGPEELRRLVSASVFARTTPAQKLRLLGMHQQEGDVAAMIGDGVNDAPALEKADIGVAMGKRGTQVAREAADVVLQDDRFGTVVTAIELGRAIFANIRKFVVYLLSCNTAEILVVTGASLAGAPLPLLPLQILFLNLVTDVFPALALGAVPGAPDLMRRPPRDPRESVLTPRHWWTIAGYGALITATVLLGFWLALEGLGLGTTEAVTLSFLTLAFAQLWHVFNMAEPESRPLRNEVSRSRLVWGAVGLCSALLLGAVYVPPVADALSVVAPDRAGWTLVAVLGLVPLLVGRAAAGVRHVLSTRE